MRSAIEPAGIVERRIIGRGVDRSDRVTAYVTTVGAASFADCIRHLELQDVQLGLRVIARVAPLPAALQLMIDDCTTPYLLQVDEDMVLDADAVRRLYDLIEREWPDAAIVVGGLHDAHLERTIEGVKISRHSMVRDFSWTSYPTVLERNEALAAAGYRIARRPVAGTDERMTFGQHLLAPTAEAAFERYRDLELLRRSRPAEIEWFADYPATFLRRFLERGEELDFFALMGVMAANAEDDGSKAGVPQRPTKDYRRASDPAFAAARQLWSSIHE